MTKITFYIARHGKTLMNTLDKVQGWCDSPLTAEGIQVAKYLGQGLKDIDFRTAYCSDLRRTRQTAEIILDTMGVNIPIVEEAGFKEACFGSFEADSNLVLWGGAAVQLGYENMEGMFKDILAKNISHHQVFDIILKRDTLNMAESFNQVETRTQTALRNVAENEVLKGDANILIIAHGMSILAMLNSLGGIDVLKGGLENASVCKVYYENGKFTVESMGDLSYVEKGKALL